MMKITGILITVLLIAGVLHGQHTEVRSVGSFEALHVAQGIDAYLKKGIKESVRIETKRIPTDKVITHINGNRLKVYKDRSGWGDYTVTVYITYVTLEKIAASSAASIIAGDTITGHRLVLDVSSAANIEVKTDVNEILADASSSGGLEIAGKAKSLDADVSSAGQVDAYELEAEIVRVDASSGATARVFAIKEIEAEASSGASVRYRGNPQRSVTDTGSGGSVRKAD